MNQLNSLIIEGNIVKAGDLSEPVNGFKVCKFSVAVNRWYKNKNNEGTSEVSFFDVETYDNMAEYCSKYGYKGRGIRIVGRLKQQRWDDENGKQHSRILIIAEHIEFKPMMNDDKSKKQTAESQKEPAVVESEKVREEVESIAF